MSRQHPVVAWFRQDLRLGDNPALAAAAATGRPILPVYILDDENAGERKPGAASRWWLHRSLETLKDGLEGRLWVAAGKADDVLPALVADTGARAVFWNRCYEPWRIRRDKALKKALKDDGVEVHTFNGSLLFEPMHVAKNDGEPYRVFTPFYRKGCLENGPEIRSLVERPDPLHLAEPPGDTGIADLGLLPDHDWYGKFEDEWQPGEAGAARRLERFLETGIDGYKEKRNRPDLDHVSRLSPHLHHGEISPQQVWYAAKLLEKKKGLEKDVDHFLSELGWREFAHHVLYHYPRTTNEPLYEKYRDFPWRPNGEDRLQAWQRG